VPGQWVSIEDCEAVEAIVAAVEPASQAGARRLLSDLGNQSDVQLTDDGTIAFLGGGPEGTGSCSFVAVASSGETVEVPNLIGMTFRPMQELLPNIGLRWAFMDRPYLVHSKPPPANQGVSSDGDLVVEQSPRAGTEVETGTVVRVRISCSMEPLPPNSVCID
jgi:PASTA domain-containing protein